MPLPPATPAQSLRLGNEPKTQPVPQGWKDWLKSSQPQEDLSSLSLPKHPQCPQAGPLASNKACGRMGHIQGQPWKLGRS